MACEIDDFYSIGDFLNVASDSREIFFRTAIGRYYYGAYHSALMVAKNWEIQCSYDPRKPAGYHMRLISSLMKYQGKEQGLIRAIGRNLLGLKSIRAESDYELDVRVGLTDVNQALYRSNKVKELCLIARRFLK